MGTFALPDPALVMPPWIFDVHIRARARVGALLGRPKGFRRIKDPGGWDRVGPASPDLVLELHDPRAALLVCAADPTGVDVDAISNLRPGCYAPGGVRWCYPLIVDDQAPGSPAALEAAHARGRMWLLSGNVPGWWQAAAALPEPDRSTRMPPLTWAQMFPEGCWAASVPLLARIDGDGVGTRPAR